MTRLAHESTSPLPYADGHTPAAASHGPRIFGNGSYSNWGTAKIAVSGQTVSIVPAPVPVVPIVVVNLIIVSFTAAWMWVVNTYTKLASERTMGLIAGSIIGALTVAGFTTMTAMSYRVSQRRGGWLVIDRAAGRLALLREGRTVPLSHLVRFEHVDMWQRTSSGRKRGSNLAELHVILRDDAGREERICLLRAISGVYRKLCRQLAAHAGVPVMKVNEAIFGSTLTVKPIKPLRA